MPKTPARRSPAFTVVELLVVIGSIVLLVALVLALVHGVRAAAARAACASNLRQIGAGLVAYDHDYGRLPGSRAHQGTAELPSFVDALTKLQKFTVPSFVCPASDRSSPSYELNINFEGRRLLAGRAGNILAAETVKCGQCHGGNGTTTGGQGSNHGPTSNYLFFDGHVEALTPEEAAGPGETNWGGQAPDRSGTGTSGTPRPPSRPGART